MRGRRYYAGGGSIMPISNNMQYVDGASHEQGGVPLASGDEVEGGEVIQQAGSPTNPSERVFSDTLRIENDPNNPTYAEAAEILAQQKAQLEQALLDIQAKRQGATEYASKRSIPERNTIERDIDKLGKKEIEISQQLQALEEATNQLFALQEQQAEQMGYRDEQGMPNEYTDGSTEQGMVQQGMMPQGGFRYGGRGRRSYASGGYGQTIDNTTYNNDTFQPDAGNTGNWSAAGSALAGAGAGAATGLALGTIVPGIGNVVGGVVGGIVGLGAGLVKGLFGRKKAREEEERRQIEERNQLMQQIDRRKTSDINALKGFADQQGSISDVNYYAKRGGRLMDKGGLSYIKGINPTLVSTTAKPFTIDRKALMKSGSSGVVDSVSDIKAPGLSSGNIMSLGASALSAAGQTMMNIDAYNRMKRYAPKAPMYTKINKYNTEINTQNQENAINSAYDRAGKTVMNNTNNAQVRRAYASNLAGQKASSLANMYTQKANTVRDIQNKNVDLTNQELEVNNRKLDDYYERLNSFNMGLANMRTGIADQAFGSINNIIDTANQMSTDNKTFDVLLSGAPDEVKNKLYKSWYGRHGGITHKGRRHVGRSRKSLAYS
jgi:hypothetical protein